MNFCWVVTKIQHLLGMQQAAYWKLLSGSVNEDVQMGKGLWQDWWEKNEGKILQKWK